MPAQSNKRKWKIKCRLSLIGLLRITLTAKATCFNSRATQQVKVPPPEAVAL